MFFLLITVCLPELQVNVSLHFDTAPQACAAAVVSSIRLWQSNAALNCLFSEVKHHSNSPKLITCFEVLPEMDDAIRLLKHA